MSSEHPKIKCKRMPEQDGAWKGGGPEKEVHRLGHPKVAGAGAGEGFASSIPSSSSMYENPKGTVGTDFLRRATAIVTVLTVPT